jgi:hypothetical protein
MIRRLLCAALLGLSLGGEPLLIEPPHSLPNSFLESQIELNTNVSLYCFLNAEDTEKPNALVIYPTSDYNGAFRTRDAHNFLKQIKQTYDMTLVFAKQENEVYDALENVSNIELLILGGHGSPECLSLSEVLSEKARIDTSDTELGNHLHNLSENASIFLYSCSNGKGKEDETNLANFISFLSNKKVYSSIAPFSSKDINIKSLVPFDLEINKGWQELTYSVTLKHF